jgi:ADP-ribosylglycohydrolase
VTDKPLSVAERIENVLIAACLGDALGAPPEAMYPGDIPVIFGGKITRFFAPPPMAPFSTGSSPGSLTDDATQMLAMAEILVESKGRPTLRDAARGLIRWADDPRGFGRFAGPTTQAAIDRLRAGEDPAVVATPKVYSISMGTTNGAAMRAPVAGCVRIGDLEGAVDVAAILSAPTHNTQIAWSGAGAVAAAIAAGLARDGKLSLGDAAMAGAQAGETLAATRGRFAAGPSVIRRLELALQIADRYAGDAEGAMAELGAVIGAGLPMAEAVPAAIGLAVAAKCDPWTVIVEAANAGNDCDTLALIAGSIAAAWSDSVGAPDDMVATMALVNGLDLGSVSADLAEVSPR